MKRTTRSLFAAALAAAALAGGTPAAVRAPAPSAHARDAPDVLGEIRRLERSPVQERDHLLVLVEVDTWVDLGPADALDEPRLRLGAWIQADGEETADADRRVVLARSFRVGDGLERNVERPEARIEGTVAEARSVGVAGRDHLVVVLRPPKPPTSEDLRGETWLADLGPAERLGLELKPEDRVTVLGSATHVAGARILLADALIHHGVRVEIDRRAPDGR